MKKKNTIELDRISNLPDSILHHIFSFLKIEKAVQSSVLSKRWRYLWTSLPTLNFEFDAPPDVRYIDEGRIKGIVDKVLILRDGSNIQKFDFCCQSLSSRYVNDWIISALRRNVEELFIELFFDDQYRLPNCLFNSKSLTILNLNSWGTFLKLTNIPADSMCLPNLKTMFLDSTQFVDDDQTNRFLSSCPVLESLTITNSIFHHTNLKISSLSLKHLTLDACDSWEEYGPVDGSFTLCTPNLISFHCNGYFMEIIYALGNLCSQRMLKFVGALHNVTNLTLPASIRKVAPALLESNFIYRNLRSLKMDCLLSGDGIHSIVFLLRMSPAIETLDINFKSSMIGVNWEVEWLPECPLNHLKRAEIREAKGSVNELKFLETLLKNAVVLETLVVVFASTEVSGTDRETQFVKFGKKLQAFPKASSSITIMLI